MLQAHKQEMLKKARQIIPDMQLCSDPHCRYCTVDSYPAIGNYLRFFNNFDSGFISTTANVRVIVPCTVCEAKKNCKIVTTIHSDPETKLIHEYYAPVCSSACATQFSKDEEEEFDRKMMAVLENRGYNVKQDTNGFWTIATVRTLRKLTESSNNAL
jgi:hypothetical protein